MLTRVGAWARIAQGLTKQCWDDTMGQWGIRQQGLTISLDNRKS